MFIYVLQLKQNKFYVGKTENPDDRFKSHISGSGSAWTKKYKPIKTIELVEGDKYDEDKYVLKYMDKYGVDNVRGGSYSKINLTKVQSASLEHISKATNDRCFKCNQSGHFASTCSHKRQREFLDKSEEYESAVEDSNEESDKDSDEELSIEQIEQIFMEADKEEGVYEIYGVTYYWDKDNSILYEGSEHLPGHRDGTFANKYGEWKPIKSEKSNKSYCYRCGRKGHYASRCYAKKHIKGYYLK